MLLNKAKEIQKEIGSHVLDIVHNVEEDGVDHFILKTRFEIKDLKDYEVSKVLKLIKDNKDINPQYRMGKIELY